VAQKGQTRGWAGHLEAASLVARGPVAPPVARPLPQQLPRTGSTPFVAALGLLVLVAAAGVRKVLR
jgi:MYXO-CTERM domain-containing protein